MQTIYKRIHDRSVGRAQLHPELVDDITDPTPSTFKEADAILLNEFVYHGMIVHHSNRFLLFPKDPFHTALNKILTNECGMCNYNYWLNAYTSDKERKEERARKYKNLLNQIHNLRQRYWYWKPIQIMFDDAQLPQFT